MFYTGWPGCTQDACVLPNSSLFEGAEGGQYIAHTVIAAGSAYT